MNRKLLAARFPLVLLLLCFLPESALAQPFTWSKAGSRPQDYDVGGDPTVSHGSANAGFIKSKVPTINGYGTYETSIAPGQYLGYGIRLSAYVRTVNVASAMGLWMRVDGENTQTLSFDDMGTRPIVGTTDWAQYEIILDIPETATAIAFGIIMGGTGEAYIDGLQLAPAARTWNVINTGTPQAIFAVRAVDENTVWAGASGGVFLRTTDGGTTWKTGTVPGASALTLNSLAAIDQNTAYYTANNFNTLQDARLYKTADGGATWTQQYRNTSAGAFFNSVAFWDANNGVAMSDPVGGRFLILTTTNGGNSWTQVPSANLPAPRANEWGYGDAGGTMLFVQGTKNVWLGTGYGGASGTAVRVFKSTDQGQTWSFTDTPLATGGPFYGIRTLAFADSLMGFAGSFQGVYGKNATTLVKTTDGGLSWSAVSALTIEPSTLQFVPHTNNATIVASSGQGFAYSNDAGDTWKIVTSTQPTFSLSFASPSVGWATSFALSGNLLKYIGDLSTAVAERPTAPPAGFHLAQNYPNPFWSEATSRSAGNPSTLIQYEIPQSAQVKLIIYNLLGEKIRALVERNSRQEFSKRLGMAAMNMAST